MTSQIQTKTIAIPIPVDLYTQLDDNKRYYDWQAGLNNFIKKKLIVVANQKKENNGQDILDLYPKNNYNKTKMVKVPIELPEKVHQQLKHYRKAVNWRQECINFLQEKTNQIEAKKQQSYGLDRPQDIAFPFLTTNKSGDNFITQFLKMGSELTGIPIVERKIENEKTDEKRERVLKDLPEQKLSHFENNAMKNFFRKHNFYVTKFPTTPPKEYPIACEILYYYFKYAGARLNGLEAREYQKELQKRTTIETYQALVQIMNANLEQIFQSEVIHYIFTLPPEKRIDVEVFDAKTMDQVADFEERAWTIKELYPFMDRKEYVVHIYDLEIFENTFIILSENDPFFRTYPNLPIDVDFEDGVIREIKWKGNWEESSIELLKLIRAFRERPLEREMKDKGPWLSPLYNVSYLIFNIEFSEKIKLGGIIFSRSNQEDNPEIKGHKLDKYIKDNSETLKEYYTHNKLFNERPNDGDAEYKIILTLHNLLRLKKIHIKSKYLSRNYNIINYFQKIDNRRSSNYLINSSMTKGVSISVELFTERNPCTACGNSIIQIQKNLSVRFIESDIKIFSFFGDDKKFYDEYDKDLYTQIMTSLGNKMRKMMLKQNNNEIVQFYEFDELKRIR